MGKKHFKKAIASLEARIREHQAKIDAELKKDFPDQGLIHHWEKEIQAFQKGIQRALKRLGRS